MIDLRTGWVCLAVGCLWMVQAESRPVVLEEPRTSPVRTEQNTIQLVQVMEGLAHPWALAFLPDGSWLITERGGRLWRVQGREVFNVDGLPAIRAGGQGGLMDLILHPDYRNNGWLYFTFVKAYEGGAGTVVARARLDNEALEDLEILYRMSPPGGGGGAHFGSRLAFDSTGRLLVTFGDRRQRYEAQTPANSIGSTVRLNDDGSIPEDNPFVGRDGYLPELWSYGHRNAQGMVVDPRDGTVWQHEHGPRGGDELNLIRPGLNYGWPVITHGEEYRGGSIGVGTEKEGMESPVVHWTPSIAPSGMALYLGDAFPEWNGNLFVGALVSQHLRRVQLEGTRVVHQEVLLHRRIGRIRDVRLGPDGHLWLLTDQRNGGLYRLERSP